MNASFTYSEAKPVLSRIQESLEDGPADNTFGFRIEAAHLGNFRFTPGDVFYFSTARVPKPGEDVAVVFYNEAVDRTSRKPVGYFEDIIIRKLVSMNDMEVILGPTPGTENENEIIPRNRINGIFPWVGTGM